MNAAHSALMDRLGVGEIQHNSNELLLPHLRGTSELLRAWGARDALCDAGLFHSIYGTEFFRTQTLSPERREEVRAVIGEEAEALVWLWCFGRRDTMPPEFRSVIDRRNGREIPLGEVQGIDLLNLWIADAVEQLPRVAHREVPIARRLLDWADRALPAGREALERLLAAYG